MRENCKGIHSRFGPSHAHLALLAILIAGSALLIQCTEQPAAPIKSATESVGVETVTRNGYTIELFATPEQQLQFTRTLFADSNQKRTALEVLIERFPEAKTVCAEAELELAYLVLGDDYRFSDSAACLGAIEKYQQIASHYGDLPPVCAKAHWYMGWIYADLLKQKRKAILHYQLIVKRYPDATLSLKPPVPWVGSVLPQAIEKPMAVYEYPNYKWSSLALLEIIRISTDEDEKWNSFEKLWSGDRASLAMEFAFRALVVDSPSLAQRVAPRARVYLEAQLFSQPIAEDIRAALESLNSKGDSKAP
jgi:hypothetical protein